MAVGVLCVAGCAMHATNSTKSKNATTGIAVTTQLGEHAVFVEGDKVRLLATLDRQAYVAVVLENARGELQQLYPARDVTRGVLHPAGVFQAIPMEGLGFPVVAPYGTETAWLVASDRALPTELLSGFESSPYFVSTRATWLESMNSYAARCNCWFAHTFVKFTTEPATYNWP